MSEEQDIKNNNQNDNLNNVVIFIIRYFGNIKLGLKKLTQTYAKAAYEIAKLIK